jgi:hypothetical protein
MSTMELVTALIATALAALAATVNWVDAARGPTWLRPIRMTAVLASVGAVAYYGAVTVGWVSAHEQGPALARPMVILLLAALASEPIARRGRR